MVCYLELLYYNQSKLKSNPTRFSKNSFVQNQLVYSQTKFSVSSRGPRLWNNILDQQQKSIDHETIFKESVKLSLLSLENEIRFFQ